MTTFLRRKELAALFVLAVLLGTTVPACAKRYVTGTTPQQAVAYEVREAVTLLRNAQTNVIAAVDAHPDWKPQADKFLNPVRDVFKEVQDGRLLPLLESYDAAVKIGDDIKKVQLETDLRPVLTRFYTLVSTALGAQLPGQVTSSISDFVVKVQETLAMLRTQFQYLRTAATAPQQE